MPTRGESAGPFPDQPGVYGMYSGDKKLQYIGLSRKVCLVQLSELFQHSRCCATLDDLMVPRELWKMSMSKPPS